MFCCYGSCGFAQPFYGADNPANGAQVLERLLAVDLDLIALGARAGTYRPIVLWR
jgi:hypothetical protein